MKSVAAMHPARHKRLKLNDKATDSAFPPMKRADHMTTEDYSNVFNVSNLLQNEGKYGSVTEDFESLHAKRMEVLRSLSALQSAPARCNVTLSTSSSICKQGRVDLSLAVIDLEKPKEPESKTGKDITSAIVLDSDDEDATPPGQTLQLPSQEGVRDFRSWLRSELEKKLKTSPTPVVNFNQQLSQQGQMLSFDTAIQGKAMKIPTVQYEKVILKPSNGKQTSPNFEIGKDETRKVGEGGDLAGQPFYAMTLKNKRHQRAENKTEVNDLAKKPTEVEMKGTTEVNDSPISGFQNQEETESPETDGLEDLWRDMSIAMECSKGTASGSNFVQEDASNLAPEDAECSHSFVLEDDIGLVCCVCGVIQKRIETIFDYQWFKGTQSTRTYMPGSRNSNVGLDIPGTSGSLSEQYQIASGITMHPFHEKKMKPHQIDGFNFLVKNLLADPPGGCILAHAPGSGKTFMLISFIQGFMAKDPRARPLIVLPKGILSTWRKEFQRWQIEEIPIYDLYTSKADSRLQQLEVLNKWHENRSILLLGYMQFASIICEGGTNRITAAVQEKLLKVPTLLILDEGHTPRNDSTDMVESLAKVQTPCKVVLSGTLFQNHVQEVFNILKLVRPYFMKSESSRAIVKRVLSRVHISGNRRPSKGNIESCFYELVEDTLRNDENHQRKISVIKELRDMTRDVLHYYKGDFLDELPGLVDYTVLLNLGSKQKERIQKLCKYEKFKKASLEKALFIHPKLMELRENGFGDKDAAINASKVDDIVETVNVRDGVKAKFFLNLLSMAESSGEKLLVFSQYLDPLKFLERLVTARKGWRTGKEIFEIFGETSSENREWSMEQFNKSTEAKVFFGSIKACGEGISLVGASRILILDVHINPSVTRQAIGRAFRPGQEKKVYAYRLVAADTQEEEEHNISFRKELISKMWFEWSEHFGHEDFDLDTVDVEKSEDSFFENPALREDVKTLYKR